MDAGQSLTGIRLTVCLYAPERMLHWKQRAGAPTVQCRRPPFV